MGAERVRERDDGLDLVCRIEGAGLKGPFFAVQDRIGFLVGAMLYREFARIPALAPARQTAGRRPG